MRFLNSVLCLVGAVAVAAPAAALLLAPGLLVQEKTALAASTLKDPYVVSSHPFLPKWIGGCPGKDVGFAVAGKDRWGMPDEVTVCCTADPEECSLR